MKQIKAVLFDLDDTLLWDEKSIQKAFEVTCRYAQTKHRINVNEMEAAVRAQARSLYASYDTYPFTQAIGINPFEALWGTFRDEGTDFEKLREIVPEYKEQAWIKGLQDLGIEDETLAKDLAGIFPRERRRHMYVFGETYQVLDEMQDTYKLLLLTNGSPDLQREKLSLSPDLAPYFDHIVISGDVGVGKPDPALFWHALDLLSVRPQEAVMVGDNPQTDILGACKIGMPAVWLNWKGREKPLGVDPAYEIEKLGELPAIVNSRTV